MKKILISILALALVTSGSALVYADQLTYDFSPEYVVGQSSWYEVLSNNTVKVHTMTEYYYPSTLQVPETEQVTIKKTGGGFSTTILDILDGWNLIYNPVVPEPEPEPIVTPEMQERIDEKIAEREQEYEDAKNCKAYGTEGNSMFQSYQEDRISKEKVDFVSLPVDAQEKELIKAHEACRVYFQIAVHISDNPEMFNKFKAQQQAELDEINRLKDLEVDTDYTDPITQEDIDETIEDAEKYLIKYPDFYKNPYGECEPAGSERCLNRGGPTEGAKCGFVPSETGFPREVCPLRDYNIEISRAISTEDNYANIENLVCEKYLSQYSALVDRILTGDETAQLPHWLSHCEVE